MRARVWALRDNLTSDDAAYVVIAEQLGGSLWTRDELLASSARGTSVSRWSDDGGCTRPSGRLVVRCGSDGVGVCRAELFGHGRVIGR